MKQEIKYDSKKLLETVTESDRNFYSKAQNKVWEALRFVKNVELSGEYSNSGWCLVFVVIDGKEYQLTKKQLRTSDLKHYFGG